MSTDWREMEAGPDLNREIAMRLGYRIEEHDGRYYLVSPDGRYTFGNGTQSAEELRYASGRSSASAFFEPGADVPDWSGSVDAALTLLDGVEWNVCMYANGTNVAFLKNASRALHTPLDPETRTPALAICRAWLAWRDD